MSETTQEIAGTDAADARAIANKLEREADMCAITYQDPERRRQVTAWHRQRVRELRALADHLDKITEKPTTVTDQFVSANELRERVLAYEHDAAGLRKIDMTVVAACLETVAKDLRRLLPDEPVIESAHD